MLAGATLTQTNMESIIIAAPTPQTLKPKDSRSNPSRDDVGVIVSIKMWNTGGFMTKRWDGASGAGFGFSLQGASIGEIAACLPSLLMSPLWSKLRLCGGHLLKHLQ